MILTVFLPETPSWLVSQGRIAEAERSMKIFRGLSSKASVPMTPECRAEFDVLIAKHHSSSTNSATGNGVDETLWQKFMQPEFYRPLGIMVGFFAFQQFSGIFVLIVYAVKFSLEAGVVIDPFLCAVYIGLVRIGGTLIIGVIMDRFGRRAPAIFSGASMAACMFGIGSYISSGGARAGWSWLPLFLILGYILVSSFGLLTLPFTMMSELYAQRYRGLASGLTTSALYSMSFLVTKMYPAMVNEMGSVNVFYFYGTVSLASVVYLYFLLPETKGKSLEQIEDMFRRQRSVYGEDGAGRSSPEAAALTANTKA